MTVVKTCYTTTKYIPATSRHCCCAFGGPFDPLNTLCVAYTTCTRIYYTCTFPPKAPHFIIIIIIIDVFAAVDVYCTTIFFLTSSLVHPPSLKSSPLSGRFSPLTVFRVPLPVQCCTWFQVTCSRRRRELFLKDPLRRLPYVCCPRSVLCTRHMQTTRTRDLAENNSSLP